VEADFPKSVHHRSIRSKPPQRLFLVFGNQPAISAARMAAIFRFMALAESNAHTMRAPAAARDRLALAE